MHSTLRPSRHALLLLAALGSAASAQTVIPSGTTRYQATAPGDYVLEEGVTRSVTSGSNEVVQLGGSTAGTYRLAVDGSILQTATGRGIRTTADNVTFDILIGETGFVRATTDDAIQGRGGPVTLTNLGTLYSGSDIDSTPTTATASGRGLNLRDAAGGTIVNGSATNSTALIRADGADAVRIGSGFTFTNYGVIRANGLVNDSSNNNGFNAAPNNSTATPLQTSDGFSFEDDGSTKPAQNSSLINHGSISGARHGVEAGDFGSNLTVTNHSTGQIIGRNGSGVGFDTLETDPAKIVVENHGLIRGDYAGVGNIIDRTGNASFTNDGDGDGVDIDGAATIRNHATGQILSTGAGGFDSGGRANNSEAISIGGGVIENHGLIRGANRGILVNNDANPDGSRSGYVSTTITNHAGATIEGVDGYAIRLENKHGDARDNDTLTNAGTIIGSGAIPDPSATVLRQDGLLDPNSTGTLDGVSYAGEGFARFIRGDGSAIQMGEGDDTLTNTGTITGSNGRAVNLEGGEDTLHFTSGTITGSIDGGSGSDILALGSGLTHSGAVRNFETVRVASGTATLSGVVSGDTGLEKTGAGTLVLSAANDYTGGTTVLDGTLRVANTTGSATGSGDVIVNTGARFGGDGRIDGNVTLNGGFTPGALIVGGDVTWNGSATDASGFAFSTPDAFVLIQGDFLKGTGDAFVFDFGGQGAVGEFVLTEWQGVTDFLVGDFSFINLASGYTGDFAIVDNQLRFTAVPEPASAAALAGAAMLGLVALRRRPRA
jgi:autotransporter-associated beta strand protein